MLLGALHLRADQQEIEHRENDDQRQEAHQAARLGRVLGVGIGNQEIHGNPRNLVLVRIGLQRVMGATTAKSKPCKASAAL
ncbi:hypothetical protein D3C83_70550 [compost metagenome]